MAISSGRRGTKPYDEYEEIKDEQDPNNLWYVWSTCQPDEDVFQKYTPHSCSDDYIWSDKSTPRSAKIKTYSHGYKDYCGRASQFPRKNFNRRRI